MIRERIKKYLPIEHYENILKIDYDNLYKSGFNTIFFDLDNTIADYDTYTPSDKVRDLFKNLKTIGFKIFILSNNKGKRVEIFSKELDVKAYSSLMKPLLYRLKKHIKIDTLKKDEIIWIGDQIVTDIKCASKLDIKAIYVDAINKNSEKWYTRFFNRNIEKIRIKQIKKYLKDDYERLKLGE